VPSVGKLCRDSVSSVDTQQSEADSQALDLVVELGVGEFAAIVDDGGSVRLGLDMIAEQRIDVAPGVVALLGPLFA
jgi:hypothetical protein